jgi:hypothetical protein
VFGLRSLLNVPYPINCRPILNYPSMSSNSRRWLTLPTLFGWNCTVMALYTPGARRTLSGSTRTYGTRLNWTSML